MNSAFVHMIINASISMYIMDIHAHVTSDKRISALTVSNSLLPADPLLLLAELELLLELLPLLGFLCADKASSSSSISSSGNESNST
jgi:hypothetical protein